MPEQSQIYRLCNRRAGAGAAASQVTVELRQLSNGISHEFLNVAEAKVPLKNLIGILLPFLPGTLFDKLLQG